MIDLGKNHHVSFSMHNFWENQSWTITLTRPLSALQSSQCEQRHHHRHKLGGRQIRRFKTRWRFSREDLTQKKKMEKLNLFAKYQRFPVKFSLKPIHTEPKEWPKKQWHCLRWGSGNPSLGPTDVLADGKLRAAPKCEDALKEHSAKNRSVGSSILFLFVPSIHGCTSSDFYIFLLDIQIVFCVCFWTPITSIISVFPNRTSMTAPFGCQHEGHLRSPECRRFVWK